MGAKHSRRVDEAVRQAVADVLEQDVADPRVAFVTVTEARVSDDARYATVFYTTLEPGMVHEDGRGRGGLPLPTADEVQAGLDRAAPRVQSLLGGRVRMRNTPTLTFRPDPVAEQGRRIEQVLREVKGGGERRR